MKTEQLQVAYRTAVKSSLVAFYGKSEHEARHLVEGWWQRLTKGQGLRSGMYLHSEALSTAANLAHHDEVELTDEVRARYKMILADSERQALMKPAGAVTRTRRVQLVQRAGR